MTEVSCIVAYDVFYFSDFVDNRKWMEYFRYFLDKVASSQPTHVCKSRRKKKLVDPNVCVCVQRTWHFAHAQFIILLIAHVAFARVFWLCEHRTGRGECNERDVCVVFFLFFTLFVSLDWRSSIFVESSGCNITIYWFDRSFSLDFFFTIQRDRAVHTAILTSRC